MNKQLADPLIWLISALKNLHRFEDFYGLTRLLDDFNIPWRESWGKGDTRSLGDLLAYLKKDEVTFRRENEVICAPLTLDVQVAVVNVEYFDYRGVWEIYEAYQVNIKTGKTISRPGFDGIGETLHIGEPIKDAAYRGLLEELGFSCLYGLKLSDELAVEHRAPQPSEKWPGLFAAYHRHKFLCQIREVLFKEDGYEHTSGEWRVITKWRLKQP